ncbi:Scr1 family TA system antitoxin-like transcriptional regulator [Kitasatospora sp. NPDC094019]|uniref:helix-turn-helix domain-containing protein n=1 Tax=Kitasatospora sp. NPDC094019 TaxID=3364091 RepID=UPI003823C328
MSAAPTASPAELFGEAVRFARERAGLTQEALAKLLHCDRTVVTRIEGGRRTMHLDTVIACDDILGTGGLLRTLWERVDWQADIEHPDWFHKYVELEEEAEAVRVLQYCRLNGLLQCADYAHAIFSLGDARNNPRMVAERVATRLSRQRRFLAAGGPTLLVTLHESAIRTVVGGPGVMRRQMEHLLSVGERYNIFIQVAPFARPVTKMPATSLSLLLLPDGREWVYSESLYRGHMSDAPAVVAEARRDFDLVRGDVLSVGESSALIADAMEEYRYEERQSRDCRLAQEQLQRGRRGRVRRGGPHIPYPRPRPGA